MAGAAAVRMPCVWRRRNAVAECAEKDPDRCAPANGKGASLCWMSSENPRAGRYCTALALSRLVLSRNGGSCSGRPMRPKSVAAKLQGIAPAARVFSWTADSGKNLSGPGTLPNALRASVQMLLFSCSPSVRDGCKTAAPTQCYQRNTRTKRRGEDRARCGIARTACVFRDTQNGHTSGSLCRAVGAGRIRFASSKARARHRCRRTSASRKASLTRLGFPSAPASRRSELVKRWRPRTALKSSAASIV